MKQTRKVVQNQCFKLVSSAHFKSVPKYTFYIVSQLLRESANVHKEICKFPHAT